METASERYSEKPLTKSKAYPELQDEKPIMGALDDLAVTKRAKKTSDFRKYTNP